MPRQLILSQVPVDLRGSISGKTSGATSGWGREAAFLDETKSQEEKQNLLRAALSGPVFLEFTPGANEQCLRGAMKLATYQEISSALEPLSPGDWRFVCRGLQLTVVEIYFRRNTYAWTMIGLSPDNSRLLCLACMSRREGAGFTLEQAAEALLRVGVSNALLIDEGADVFQKVPWDDGHLTDMMVSRLRRRVRATFIFHDVLRQVSLERDEKHEFT